MPESDHIDQLAERLGRDWPAIRQARKQTSEKRGELETLFPARRPPDTSLVVFGSVARQEATEDSDLDWILLVDGQSAPEHKDQEREAKRVLAEGFIEPGRSGVFGGMVGSHDLVHNIGGEDDLNSNTTRRVLLLLESFPIGNDRDGQAYFRVRRQV